jgi:hypothetical protein
MSDVLKIYLVEGGNATIRNYDGVPLAMFNDHTVHPLAEGFEYALIRFTNLLYIAQVPRNPGVPYIHATVPGQKSDFAVIDVFLKGDEEENDVLLFDEGTLTDAPRRIRNGVLQAKAATCTYTLAALKHSDSECLVIDLASDQRTVVACAGAPVGDQELIGCDFTPVLRQFGL